MWRARRSVAQGGTDLSQRLLTLSGLVLIVGVVIGVLLVAGLLGNQGGGKGIRDVVLLDTPKASSQAGLEIGPEFAKLAPDFEISDFDGTRHRLSDFRGKVVFINFWATWCVPCTVELPDIQELQRNHPEELVVITVNRREALDSATAYFRNVPLRDGGTGVDFTVNGMDPDDTLYQEYDALGMPASFFIKKGGQIDAIFNGIVSSEDMEFAFRAAINPL